MNDLASLFVKRVRDVRHLHAQAETLRAFGAHRAATVVAVRSEERELVLETIVPGLTLASIASEDEAMRVVADLLIDGGWPRAPYDTSAVESLSEFACALDAPDPRLARAAAVRRELAADEREAVLLHGDLHYGNVLSSHRAGWLLIDAGGVVGPREFDIGYLVSRPMPSAQDRMPLARAVERRLAFLPEALGLDRARVAAYAYVAAALSLAWAIEDRDANRAAFAEAMAVLGRSQR